ncbi:uncharacterized protein LOC114364986 [Ostrinia furnacalis]|uniref:uncharacterized protein LOC114364986 n=1 Tax=Ostrinia furnacalis TaxID=93504 RepID=UPI001039A316|nr:uncharacterized protein LOC114364986 [Ostrinia furnacalis]
MGGAWERMVRTVKTALKAMLAEQVPKDELLCTALHEAEALVNSRPLTHASSEPHAPESLTPFHFLIGSSSPYHPIKTDAGDLLSGSDWRKSQRLAELFWQRWVKEYLPLIAPRRSPKGSSSQNFRIGDLILIADGNLPRGTWPRGRISAVHPGKDGIIIRVTEVTTLGGILRRPVTKLVKLPSSPPLTKSALPGGWRMLLAVCLSADAAVMCLRRFVARRGTPCKILSDNGTAFVGANNLLLASYQQCFGDECANQHISWQFIPLSAPNMGGAWERMVRTVKTALKAMLAEQVPKDELLCTALHETEALVNSRPLTHASSEPHAPE